MPGTIVALQVAVAVTVSETDQGVTYAQIAITETVPATGDTQQDFLGAAEKLQTLPDRAKEEALRHMPVYIERAKRELGT